jgi:hypothetical protein
MIYLWLNLNEWIKNGDGGVSVIETSTNECVNNEYRIVGARI